MLEVASLVLLVNAIAELPAVSGDDAVRREVDAALRLDGLRRLACHLVLTAFAPGGVEVHHAGIGIAGRGAVELDGDRAVIVVLGGPEVDELDALTRLDLGVGVHLRAFAQLNGLCLGVGVKPLAAGGVEHRIARIEGADGGTSAERGRRLCGLVVVRDLHAQPEAVLPLGGAAIVRAIADGLDGEARDLGGLHAVGRLTCGRVTARFALAALGAAAAGHRARERRRQRDGRHPERNLPHHGSHHLHHSLSHHRSQAAPLRRRTRRSRLLRQLCRAKKRPRSHPRPKSEHSHAPHGQDRGRGCDGWVRERGAQTGQEAKERRRGSCHICERTLPTARASPSLRLQ